MSSTEPEPSIQALSLASINECKFGFVSEGGANVVFEVLVEPGSEYSSIFQGQLLRVPKAGTKAHSYSELQEYWETIVRPLFRPEDLVQQRLIKLEGRELAARLNHVLEREEASRRADFKGSRVAETEYGMLVEDMRKTSNDDDDDDLSGAGRFQLAMTLRDCACFLRVPADPGSPVEAKLGDLDKKNGAAKLGYWQRVEKRLIEGGYYAGREVEGVEVNCRLARDGELAYREGGMGSI
ncbi:hypothetical protein MYCTH_2062719 [Thermothelomyces thermophilus ATCC 42464]|uniref:Inositol-pentakisphosphate 2-kinase n=1 Tax=Thermothelomyces thermophilus (strain ATCC 42464 / BCRC 31852 / DSM 1799) TaxID=573729 RepID=G2QEK2_THET4|nr:uncharacterized protein MYCTH_2062719 [Thermothelomyces thermophilus ATCC 42464]AEO57785.1 hypothetical protein MYCTH_2062719 [Thermothelomyces thermophilus ATCC 42464]